MSRHQKHRVPLKVCWWTNGGDLVSLFGSGACQTLLCQFLEFSNPADDSSRLNFQVLWLPPAKHRHVVLPEHLNQKGIQPGAPGNKLLENMTESRNHVCKRSGDPKTCFVDFRVETFNFVDLAPTVQSRRVRDKKECFRFHLVQLL